MRLGIASYALLAALAIAGSARASEEEPGAEPVNHAPTWYGWQTLLADGAFIALAATAPAWHWDGTTAVMVLDTVAFYATTPAIHGTHGNGTAGGVSLAMRVGLSLMLGWAGATIASARPCSGLFCQLDAGLWGAYDGAMVGASIAAVVDGFALAWERYEPHATTGARSTWTLAPAAMRSGGGLAVVGIF